jgi:DNA-binding NarL/FixJ family response regulator
MTVKTHLKAGPRQREILSLLVLGRADKAIAQELDISVATVRTYLTRLYRDNGFENRTEAVAAWVRLTASDEHD